MVGGYKGINQAIAKYLADSGDTRQHIADELGITTNSLRFKMAGKYDWKFSEVIKLSALLGVDPDGLLEDAEQTA